MGSWGLFFGCWCFLGSLVQVRIIGGEVYLRGNYCCISSNTQTLSHSRPFNSNSLLLEEELGYTGLCVEPFPSDFQGRKCELVKYVIGNRDKESVSMRGSGQLRQVKNIKKNNMGDNDGETSMTFLSSSSLGMTTFATLLKDHKVPKFVNFISLDVEGQEYPSLVTFPFDEVSGLCKASSVVYINYDVLNTKLRARRAKSNAPCTN